MAGWYNVESRRRRSYKTWEGSHRTHAAPLTLEVQSYDEGGEALVVALH